ncbi:MFS general substrate transporter [Mytilinidion resinicola]|uniref:MFS general substrate transporter n=1 Tax=Mytilinidion resinicola TaxID=574789 RepID=A0A6A6ZAQ1_9PEZI|nr:MFS general substrate transporter [Mytilinidion resinicola]KAF2817374.1 MFS general substrate transporter [Mytilinidion resinicola]
MTTASSEDRGTGTESLEAPPMDRKTMLKLDLRLVPILGACYTIMFLDRTNIANARIEGLEKGLNMPLVGYNTSLWIFYIPFVLVEIPSNLIMSLPRVKPNWFLGLNVLILGIVSTCQGLSHSYSGFLAVRFFMGIFEAILPSGTALLLASYYTKRDAAVRFGLFFAFAQLGPCFSGLLAYALENMDGVNGLAGWRWIFIIEGIMTIIIGFLVVLIVPNFPERAKFLTSDERARLHERLVADKGAEKLDIKNVPWLKIIFDYKIWIPTVFFFCADMTAASMSSFIPTILVELGWKTSRAQVMTIPIWVSCIVVQVGIAWVAGRTRTRSPYILGAICVVIIGWVIEEVHVKSASVRYMSLFFLGTGTFTQMTLIVSWMTCNLRGRASTAVGTAMLLGLGNCANFVASNVFITKERPLYPTGFRTGLAITVLGFASVVLFTAILAYHNKRLDAKRTQTGDWEDTQEEYRYVL